MTVEDALNILEKILDKQPLNNIQRLVFRGVWEHRSYMDIAKHSDYDYGYVKDIGYELWRSLSEVLGEKVTKNNVQVVLQRYDRRDNAAPIRKFVAQEAREDPPAPFSLVPQSYSFSEDQETRWAGRSQLIETLTQKLQQNCRILNLVGITGIGKSSLSIRLSLEPQISQTWPLVKVIQCDRENDTFAQMARLLLGEQVTQNEELCKHPKQLIECMIGQLQSSPSLLIIDMVEELLVAGEPTSQTQKISKSHQYRNPLFAEFFEQFLTVTEMPSRLILNSQILPPVIADGRYDARTHLERLSGLTDTESVQLFEMWDIQVHAEQDITCLHQFTHAYEGHPLALKVIAGEIREMPYLGNIQAYWHDYGPEIERVERAKAALGVASHPDIATLSNYSLGMTDLVEQRVERALQRLKRANVLAYNLLCMGAVYRGSVERAGWLTMISESPKQEQLQAWQTLQRRFLLEENITTNNRVQYRLHSLIRSVALQHLNQM